MPAMQNVVRVGPIPRGTYSISAPFNSPDHGPFAMHLVPDLTNDMMGRSVFLLHGDNIEHPGCASEGCVIMPRVIREKVWSSGDRKILVIV